MFLYSLTVVWFALKGLSQTNVQKIVVIQLDQFFLQLTDRGGFHDEWFVSLLSTK